mmetsp:Transcript_154640/g.269310  ORF Transcript_154640/g.269310 Transcript_154640/m.269310 type:complete len:88 (+) Transcript_154640:824-1087(+)
MAVANKNYGFDKVLESTVFAARSARQLNNQPRDMNAICVIKGRIAPILSSNEGYRGHYQIMDADFKREDTAASVFVYVTPRELLQHE